MSGTNSSAGGLTRRGFLKATGAAAGVLGLAGAGGMLSTDGWLVPAEANAEPEERVAYTFHNRHCQCLCSHKCTVRDGRIAKIEPNELPNGDASICAKGISEVQHVYSAERIQTPLQRVGERGSDEFVSITWDEAMRVVGDGLRGVQDAYGKDAVLTIMAGEVRTTEYLFLQKLIGARGVSDTAMNEGIDIGQANGFDRALGNMAYQTATSSYADWKNCKTVLNVGTNILETTLTYSRYFFDALEAGAKIYTVDPHYTPTASKSSVWVPIAPGTDPALYLGMISLILDNGWYDSDYLVSYTDMPFLVDVSTGLLAHEGSDEGQHDYLVWDSLSGAPRPYGDSGASPQLDGTFEYEGRTVATVFSLLKKSQKEYTAEWAAEKTGIAQDVLFEMTRDYACNGPQILSVGLGGSDKFWNADIAGHAEIILASLVGSIGSVEGAGAGAYILQWRRGKLDTGSWKLPAEFVAGKNAAGVYDIRDDENIHAIITGGNCLHDRMANMNKTIEWMNKMDFILAIDIYHTPTTTYADIVLPACSRYESDEEIGMLHSGHHCLMLKEKVIDPLFESRTDFAIEKGIAEVFGVDQYLPSTAEELVRTQLSSSTDARVSSVTIEDIVASNGVYFIPWREDEIHNYPDKTFKTPTKRIELYHEDLLEYNNALPIWEPPVEATPENAQSGPYPLQLAQQHTRFLTHCAFADAEWIRQYIEPFVDLNPLDANDRGIATGDMVIVENDRGSFECKARVNECVRPGSARVYEGWWTKYFASGNIQMVANDNRNERGAKGYYGPVIPFNDTLVEVRKA